MLRVGVGVRVRVWVWVRVVGENRVSPIVKDGGGLRVKG